ncbi:hypothetical protein [Agrobacterium tumefaciens]|nr:hypothetical protein [Agrobacterium tumefaciens]
MNQMVTISYEEQLKAKAKAVRQRLMGKGVFKHGMLTPLAG